MTDPKPEEAASAEPTMFEKRDVGGWFPKAAKQEAAPLPQPKAMTHEEAVKEAERRWGNGDAVMLPMVGCVVTKSGETMGVGRTWEAAFAGADKPIPSPLPDIGSEPIDKHEEDILQRARAIVLAIYKDAEPVLFHDGRWTMQVGPEKLTQLGWSATERELWIDMAIWLTEPRATPAPVPLEEAVGEVSAKWDDVLKQCMDFIVRPGEPSDRAIYWCVGVIADLKTALRELRRLDERLAEYRTTLGEKEDFINAQEDELHEKDAELSDWKGNYERMKAVALSDRAELRRVKDESEAFSKIAMRLRELNGELEAELRRREAK